MEYLKDRLKLAMSEKDVSAAELSRACGVSKTAVSYWLSGEVTELKGPNLMKISAYLDIRPEWLESGSGTMKHPISARVRATESADKANALITLDDHPDLVSIRRVRFKLQAGVQGYAIEVDNGNAPPVFFRKDWLESRGYRSESLMAVKVAGASMEPGLFDGDLVVVNTADTTPADGEPFAVNYEGEMGVKRLKRDAGEWWLASDNQDKRRYPDKRCNGDVQLIGRVIYKQSERV